jgi:hypothetical protein
MTSCEKWRSRTTNNRPEPVVLSSVFAEVNKPFGIPNADGVVFGCRDNDIEDGMKNSAGNIE